MDKSNWNNRLAPITPVIIIEPSQPDLVKVRQFGAHRTLNIRADARSIPMRACGVPMQDGTPCPYVADPTTCWMHQQKRKAPR